MCLTLPGSAGNVDQGGDSFLSRPAPSIDKTRNASLQQGKNRSVRSGTVQFLIVDTDPLRLAFLSARLKL